MPNDDRGQVRPDHILAVAGTGGLSRRRFGEAALVGSLLASSIGSGILRPDQAQAQPAPVRGGNLRVAFASQSTNDTFDSARYLYANDYVRGTSVYSYLTRLDGEGVAQPEVALSWEPNAEATRWIFRIRSGIVFSDGSPLALEDVIFSILRHKEDKVASSAKQLAGNIKTVTKEGEASIAVELAEPDVDLPVLIGIFQFALVKAGTYDFAKPLGTGPFVVKEFAPGLRTVLTRNDKYWKEGKPYLDQIEMFTIIDASARANALLSGDAQMITELRGSSIEEVSKSNIAGIFVTPSTRYTSFQAAMDRPPSSNQDLALAMTYLIDRKRALDTVLRGYGSIANDHPIGPSSPYCNKALPQRGLDPDKAKFHIAKSGIGNTKIEVAVSDAVIYSVDMGQLLQREAARAGLNLELKREPADSYWNAVAGKRPFFAANFHPRPTYNMLLNLAWKGGAAWNFSHYSNPKLDQLIDQARATLDQTRLKEIYDQIQAIIHGSGALMAPCFLNYVDGISNKVKGLKPVPVGNLGGFNFADSIWLDS
jgi:peptide/nickel transport system substrate-binding protein